jgi:hypothetical protein
MMSVGYVRHALATAIRVARFDRSAMGDFDHSFEGFFRSFAGIVLCLPIYAVILFAERRIAMDASARLPDLAGAGLPPPDAAFYAVEGLTYLLDWLAFPLAMIGIARLIGAGARYVPYIIAYNWSGCLVLAATMIPYAIYLAGLISLTGVIVLYYPVAVFTLVYRWRIARDGLQITPMTATGIVIFDFLLSVFVALLAARLRGA